VFGCGGDRDRTKRPLMGEIAARLADRVFVTSDNPRTEDPDQILQDVLAGIPASVQPIVLADRAIAIRAAILQAQPGDGILIAGKGHEDYQILGTEKVHFDDREQAAAALSSQTLNQELRQQAEQEAHTLAGSLGTFGFEHASQLARLIEPQFQSSDRLSSDQIHHLQQLIATLRQEISRTEAQSTPTTQPDQNHCPLLLIIDTDRPTAESIIAEAASWGLRAELTTNLAIAKYLIQQEQPQVILLDLAVSKKTTDSFNLLAELQQQMPSVPVLVSTSKEDLQHRREVVSTPCERVSYCCSCPSLQRSGRPDGISPVRVPNRSDHQAQMRL